MRQCKKIDIGLPLPLEWQPVIQDIKPANGKMSLIHFRNLGFDYVEFSVGPLASSREAELLEEGIQACRAAGLGMAVHPYLGGVHRIARFTRGSECRAAVDRLVKAAETAAQSLLQPVTMIFHAAEEDFDPGATAEENLRTEMLSISRDFANYLENAVHKSDCPLRIALEHQVPPAPEENIVRTGDTAAELLQVVKGTDLSLCWDTGHYRLSMERHGQPAQPPEEFVSRITHVHLHDVIDGEDHRPINADSHQLHGWVRRLRADGFLGTITLEYDPRAVAAQGGIRRVAARSLTLLQSWLSE